MQMARINHNDLLVCARSFLSFHLLRLTSCQVVCFNDKAPRQNSGHSMSPLALGQSLDGKFQLATWALSPPPPPILSIVLEHFQFQSGGCSLTESGCNQLQQLNLNFISHSNSAHRLQITSLMRDGRVHLARCAGRDGGRRGEIARSRNQRARHKRLLVHIILVLVMMVLDCSGHRGHGCGRRGSGRRVVTMMIVTITSGHGRGRLLLMG